MGSWDGDKAKDDLLKEKNFKTLAKSVCLLLEDGWENKEKGALKYPVMNLKNGKWVYNAQGLSSARAYGEQHDPSIADKAISIQKKLGLYKDNNNNNNKEENMEKKDVNFSDSENKEKDVIMEEVDMSESENFSNDEKKDEEKETDEKDMCGDKKLAEESEDEKLKDEKEEEKDIKDEEKKFSLDAYVDATAMLSMLEKETEELKNLADKVIKEFSANEIVENFIKMAKENAELKAEKEKADAEKQSKKFASIMASVKEDLDEKTFSELSEEGKSLSLEQLGAFENKVKAFAYEATKKNKEQNDSDTDDIMKFGATDNSEEYDNDVFNRIAKM